MRIVLPALNRYFVFQFCNLLQTLSQIKLKQCFLPTNTNQYTQILAKVEGFLDLQDVANSPSINQRNICTGYYTDFQKLISNPDAISKVFKSLRMDSTFGIVALKKNKLSSAKNKLNITGFPLAILQPCNSHNTSYFGNKLVNPSAHRINKKV